MPVKPRYASTVVLFKGSGQDIKVYMIKRREDLAFLGGFYAFPGGALSREDCSPIAEERTKGLTNEKAGEILNSIVEEPFTALGFWNAGIRELFEEAGVLLAETEEGNSVPFHGRESLFQGSRGLLHEKKMSFYDILKKENLDTARS
jgi:8-oxo-dGTP pyrophosphatase MutT (NUDIX family)